RRTGRLCDVVLDLRQFRRSARHLSRRPLCPSEVSRQGPRQGAARPSRARGGHREGRAHRMVGARLEQAVDRVLRATGRAAPRRLVHVSSRKCRVEKTGRRMSAAIVLVLAVADNGVIGDKGAIPWRIADDMKRFKALTMGKPIIMGRKTWDSFPK